MRWTLLSISESWMSLISSNECTRKKKNHSKSTQHLPFQSLYHYCHTAQDSQVPT